jgi:putative endonuclease
VDYDDIIPAVYIVASRYRGTIYTGVTSNLVDRITAHKEKLFKGFTADYNCNILVWYENHATMPEVIRRETQIKAWKRIWKIELIEGFNRDWLDLHDAIEHRPYEWANRGSKSPAKGGRLE